MISADRLTNLGAARPTLPRRVPDARIDVADDGPKRLTLVDVAERAGVSRSLASLALRGEPGVQPEKRARILRIAAELDYVPDPAARNLASSASRTLGILLSDILNPFSASLVKAIDAEARRRDFDVLLSIDGHPDSAAEAAIAGLVRQRVAGVVLVGAPESVALVERTGRRVPVVYVGRQLASERVDCVSNDDGFGASLLVEHLFEQGHRDVLHIDGGQGAGSRRRAEGYEAAMTRHGLMPRIVRGGQTLDAGARAIEAIIADGPCPTAIFAANDVAAVGVVNHLLRSGRKIPQDVAVVGYDDMPFAESEVLSLTTVRQPIASMAEQSLDAIVRRIRRPGEPTRTALIAPTLVIRRSSSR